ncbi:hypothetical protein WG66_004706 [Moniliophthora roreri]|nr:hypothetical protein WG66_004706 [Moniliophthora roreri]
MSGTRGVNRFRTGSNMRQSDELPFYDLLQSLSRSKPAQNLRSHHEVDPRVMSLLSGASDSLQGPDAGYQIASPDTNKRSHSLVQSAAPASTVSLAYYQGSYNPLATSLPNNDNTPHDKQYQDATTSSTSRHHTITSANTIPIYNSKWPHTFSDDPQKAQPSFKDSSPSQSQSPYSVTNAVESTSIVPQYDSYDSPTAMFSPGDDVRHHVAMPLSASHPPATQTTVEVIQMGRVAKDNVIRASFKRRRKRARS